MAQRRRILIVDDERDYADVLKDRLEFEGFEVDAAYDGLSGLEAVEGFKPDLILLDIMMPGMDGFEFASALKARGCHLPVVFVTAYGRTFSERERETVGSSPVIRKPFEADELLEVISKSVA